MQLRAFFAVRNQHTKQVKPGEVMSRCNALYCSVFRKSSPEHGVKTFSRQRKGLFYSP
jgi:hypothetical protein